MSNLLDRVTWSPEPAVGPNRTGVATLVGRLEAGEPPADLKQAEGLAPGDLVAALAALVLGPKNGDGLPLVQSHPPRPRIEPALHSVAQHTRSGSPTGRLVLAAGLLQIFDFWDASHTAAQVADDRGDPTHLGALWHAIAHRREPDPGNSSYWYRRVGRDPGGVFSKLAESAAPVIEAANRPPWSARVLRSGNWDPFAFIEVCGTARPGSDDEKLARQLQRLEMLAALDATWAHIQATSPA